MMAARVWCLPLLLTLTVLLAGCPSAPAESPPAPRAASGTPQPQPDDLATFRAVPAHNRDMFPAIANTTLAERVGDMPAFVLEFMREFDQEPSYREYQLTAAQKQTVIAALGELPPLTATVLEQRLLGIYFIEGFLGNGLCDFVFDDQGTMYVYMVFNPHGLDRTISELLTEKENTCFIPTNGGVAISIDCGSSVNGWQYILLHESTHAVDYVKTITPYVEEQIKPLQRESGYSNRFTNGIWEGYDQPAPACQFALRDMVTFYGFSDGPKLVDMQAPEVYGGLAATPFVSLYGSTCWPEDLAELVAFYHLTEKMGQPYTITVTRLDREIYSGQPLQNKLVRDRLPFIEQTFY